MAQKKSSKPPVERILPTNPAEKKKMLDTTIADIEKNFGKGSIMKLGNAPRMQVSAISTGSLTLDMALGIGGLPKGRIIEIYGPESSGKTTLALHVVAEAQKAGGEAAFVDAEHALDPIYAKALGVDIDELLVSQPDSGEQALEITEALVRSGAVDIVVVDSVAALVPREEIDGNMGDKNMALQARLMSQAMRKLSGIISKTNTIVIFINQLRDSLKVTYGDPSVTTGGRALKFYASVRIDIRKSESLKTSSAEIFGNHVRCKVVKNKVSPPFKIAEFDIIFGKGISRSGELLDLGLALNIINKSGTWFSYDGQRIGQGKEKARDFISENKEVYDEILTKILGKKDDIDLSLNEEIDPTELEEQDNDLDITLTADDF